MDDISSYMLYFFWENNSYLAFKILEINSYINKWMERENPKEKEKKKTAKTNIIIIIIPITVKRELILLFGKVRSSLFS